MFGFEETGKSLVYAVIKMFTYSGAVRAYASAVM
jgi:hypothetical protein